ncbi:MAG: type II/IV secretion system ATPase subunit [Fervidicoccaceae archaeon]
MEERRRGSEPFVKLKEFFEKREKKMRLLSSSHSFPEIAGNSVSSYDIGAFRVSIVESGSNFAYVVKPLKNIEDLRQRIEERLEEIILLMKRGNDIGDVISAVLKIERERIPDAIYVLRNAVGYGKLQAILDDPYILDLSVEGPGQIWVRHSLVEMLRPEQDFVPTNIIFNSNEEIVMMQQVIATKCNTFISTSNPILDSQLPPKDGGHRVHLVFPTVSHQRPEIVIRKRLPMPPSIEQYIEMKVMPRAVAELLRLVLNARGSVIVAGPPGSGKTTVMRSLLYHSVPKTWKVMVIEDTGEIDPPQGSPWTRYTTFELGSVKVDLFDLAKASLRASGTRLIVVGETRGQEARVLAQAMMVGLGALTSFHGSSPEEVSTRLMSPPINLAPSQVGMFHFVAIMGFGDKPRRQLKLLAELKYDPLSQNVVSKTIWDRDEDGMEISLETLISRSEKIEELEMRLEKPFQALNRKVKDEEESKMFEKLLEGRSL